jgi:uncharacterized SAM-binding protein YcdF (DUF218 family)
MLLPFDPSRTERVRSAGWRRTLVAAGVLAVCLTLGWSLRGPLLQGLAQLWVVSESPGRADAIVVLGGGLDTRPFAVAELYRRGFATRVLLANTKTGPAEELGVLPPHMDLNRAVLIRLGVPSEAISLFGEQLSNTYEEARALRIWAQTTGARALLLPTDSFSTRRVRWIVGRELAEVGGRVHVQAIDPREYTLGNWWQHEQGLIGFQNEVLKYLFYRVKYWARSEPPASNAAHAPGR